MQFVVSWRKTQPEFDPRKYFAKTVDSMKQICIDRYEAFGTAGNADKIRPISLEKWLIVINNSR